MSKYHAMITVNGKRTPIKREVFTKPEMREFINALAPRVMNKTLEMNQAGLQIYRKLGLTPPAIQGCHWIFKSAARFNGIEPWASHKLRREKGTDPVKLTIDGLKLTSEIEKSPKRPVKKLFFKFKNGTKIPITNLITDEVKNFITPLCEKVNNGSMSEMNAGKELFEYFKQPMPASGTFWFFKAVAKYNGIEPWASNKRAEKKQKVSQARQSQTTSLENNEEVKVLKTEIYELKEQVKTISSGFKDLRESVELLMSAVDKIEAAEGVYLSAENDKEIVLRVPTNRFFKQAAVVEDVKVGNIVKGKKIVIVGPESSQIRNFTERLPGAILNFFTGKNLSEKEMLLQKCESADLIVVWPRFSGHWATGCTRQFKEKCITTRAAGVKFTVDEIIERLKWN